MNGRMIIPEWVEKSSGDGIMIDGCGNNVYCVIGVFLIILCHWNCFV